MGTRTKSSLRLAGIVVFVGIAASGMAPVAVSPAAVTATEQTSQGASWMGWRYLKNAAGGVANPSGNSGPTANASRWIDGTQPIYAMASLSSERLMAQAGGTEVKLLDVAGLWSYVQAPTGPGWILNSSLASSSANANGNSTTSRWTTAEAILRKGASASDATIGIIPENQKIGYLKTTDGWSEVKTGMGAGWIKNDSLTMIEYRVPLELQPTTRLMIGDIEKRFGQDISGIGGSRSGSTGHSLGLAADFMIKKYDTAAGIRAGDEMVEYMIANSEKLGLSFIIWRDRIWLDKDGQWGPYSDGGWGKHLEMSRGWNATTRHMDHIHAEIHQSRSAK